MSESGTGEIEERVARLEQQDERMTRALELLAQREAAPDAKPRRNWNGYSAVIASLVGLLALAVSGYTAYVQRQQLRAQVWPYLHVWTSDSNVGMYVTNHGTGPARVTAVHMTVGGVLVKTWADVEQATGFTGALGLGHSSIGGMVLPPGKDYSIMVPSDDGASRAKLKELLQGGQHRVGMTICYCSILDDCWVAPHRGAGQDEEPGSPDSCPILADERFQG